MPAASPRLQFPPSPAEKITFLHRHKERLLKSPGCLVVLTKDELTHRENGSHNVRFLEMGENNEMYFIHVDDVIRYESLAAIPRTQSIKAEEIDHIFLDTEEDDDER